MKKIILLVLVIFIQLISCNKNIEQLKSKLVLSDFENSKYNFKFFYSEIDSLYSSIDSMQIFKKKKKFKQLI